MYNIIGIVLIMASAACYAKLSYMFFYPSNNQAPLVSFWGQNSWMLKYKFYQKEFSQSFIVAPNNWYYKLFNIHYKERFPLSATLLVWLTDGFHFMQFVMLWCISSAIVITHYNLLERPWWWTLSYIVFYRVLWSATFTVFFNFIFKK